MVGEDEVVVEEGGRRRSGRKTRRRRRSTGGREAGEGEEGHTVQKSKSETSSSGRSLSSSLYTRACPLPPTQIPDGILPSRRFDSLAPLHFSALLYPRMSQIC